MSALRITDLSHTVSNYLAELKLIDRDDLPTSHIFDINEDGTLKDIVITGGDGFSDNCMVAEQTLAEQNTAIQSVITQLSSLAVAYRKLPPHNVTLHYF